MQSSTHISNRPELIIVGAGLAGLLTAHRVLTDNPDVKIDLYDSGARIGGDHTWSFNLSDIDARNRDWLKPFISYQWPGYSVRFPKYNRDLDIPYCSANSQSLRDFVTPFVEAGRLRIHLGQKAEALSFTRDSATLRLHDGDVITARMLIDARGHAPVLDRVLGFQKFVGKTIRTKTPHGLTKPIIMDATVEQLGGYRFVYCLPFSDTEILVEDTYYTDQADLDVEGVKDRIDTYIAEQGWQNHDVIREETGILPITLASSKRVIADSIQDHPPQIGLRGGLFNAVTGYSVPDAVRMAEIVSRSVSGHEVALMNAVGEYRLSHWRKERFYRLLNRMLFRAAEPEARYKVLQRFYRLKPDLIQRFYAGTLTKSDKVRILSGKPPVPITKALQNYSESGFIKRENAL